jgi:hypothetical protein
VILQKVFKNIAIGILKTIRSKKIDKKFSFASKSGLVWPYLSRNMWIFQPRKVQIQMKKDYKFSRS